MESLNPIAWEVDFPQVYGHTSTSFLTHCHGFKEAKGGDMGAAMTVVKKCANINAVIEIKQKYPDAILLPVITKNRLPEALTEIMSIKTHLGVYEVETLSRKTLSGMARFLHKPVFTGRINRGSSYIIVDDIITQGGTVSELRKHVILGGGRVCAVTALSCSVGSKTITPSQGDIDNLTNKFNLDSITSILRYYNIAWDLRELTRAQIMYILRFNKLEGLVSKIEKTQKEMNALYFEGKLCLRA